MRSSSMWSRDVTVLDPNKTFENIRFLKSKNTEGTIDKYDSLNIKIPSISTGSTSVVTTNYKNDEIKYSDVESSFTSISQIKKTTTNSNKCSYKAEDVLSDKEPALSITKSAVTDVKEQMYCLYNGNESTLSGSNKEYESDESFLTMANREKDKYNFINPKEELLGFLKPLRVYNKNGKPLTDRMGRPLIDILGQPLVVLDDKGRLISDSKGNQVFNSLGESAIYSSTNLHIPPSEEGPGIPLLDVDKKHIIFLYDNKGHPLTDSLGRPLIKASGSPMFGLKSTKKIALNSYKENSLNNLYGKAPLENVVRRVQIFDSNLQPLTDERGNLFRSARIICNKNGMPMCDENGQTVFFKYGMRILKQQTKDENDEKPTKVDQMTKGTLMEYSKNSLIESNFETKLDNHIKECHKEPTNNECKSINNNLNSCNTKFENNIKTTLNNTDTNNKDLKNKVVIENISSENDLPEFGNPVKFISDDMSKGYNDSNNKEYIKDSIYKKIVGSPNNNKSNSEIVAKSSQNLITYSFPKRPFAKYSQKSYEMTDCKDTTAKVIRNSKEAIILFDASKKMENQKSSMNTIVMKNIKGTRISHSIIRRKPRKKMYTSNFIEYFKNALNLTTMKQNDNRPIYNDYGKPMRDFYGNLLYDKFGMPLTGAHGIKLSEKARHALRIKLRNIPVLPANKDKAIDKEIEALACKESHDEFGDPFYDKYGRPLYDLYGKLIYDVYGRPLTDAYGRPLIDAIGQPLMDSEGNVLTSAPNCSSNNALCDIFGRRLYDKRGKALFDSYGRPRFDIFTNAIYDNCGRPAKDANGIILFDFLNKPIQPHPDKPLYKNARILLPRYIDRVLAMPSMHRVLKYSRASLKDVFGGPLFDDFGRPLYNKLGMPLYDKYGRPLYDKEGRPLCDCYGRPLSEEIRQNPNDQTLSVLDSLKLLKLTKESSKWMEIKRSQTKSVKATETGILENAIIMKVVQPAKKKSTQYTYALTRVTRFACGRQNPNESLNNVIWARLPKRTFVNLGTLKFGVFGAVLSFGYGYVSKQKVLKEMELEPGENMNLALRRLDVVRVNMAEKAITDIERNIRQKRTLAKRKLEELYQDEEDPNNPSYCAGSH